jgi:hypothetical protein
MKQSPRYHHCNDAGQTGREATMNHSIYSADRMTHLKIVAVAVVAGFGVAILGISVRPDLGESSVQTARIIKAGQPVMLSGSDAPTVR